MRIVQSGLTDIGQKRKVNQDSILLRRTEDGKTSLSMVADGMGGHTDGEVASGLIRDFLAEWWDSFDAAEYNDFEAIMNSIQTVVRAANDKIYMEYNNGSICGSTCILMFVHDGCYGIVNAGDSHIYMKRGFSIKSVMTDDVWENQRAIREIFTPQQIKNHTNYGKLVNAVGTEDSLSLSLEIGKLKKNDTFILCSDGLYKYCPYKSLKRVLWRANEKNMDECVHFLKEETYKAGAKDNLSLVVVKYVK